MGRKLEIDEVDALSAWTAREVSSISSELGDEFRALQSMCLRDHLALTAMAQVERDRRKKERQSRWDDCDTTGIEESQEMF